MLLIANKIHVKHLLELTPPDDIIVTETRMVYPVKLPIHPSAILTSGSVANPPLGSLVELA